MYKVIVFFLGSLAVFSLSYPRHGATVPLASTTEQPEGVQHLRHIEIIKDIKAYISQNPHLRLIRLQKKAPVNQRLETVRYTLGSRLAGDRLVGQYANSFFYPALKDVSTQVTYPETGIGSLVTSVDIDCLQDISDGNAYIVGGGIGQRVISIVLEATQTERFSYNMHVYGTD